MALSMNAIPTIVKRKTADRDGGALLRSPAYLDVGSGWRGCGPSVISACTEGSTEAGAGLRNSVVSWAQNYRQIVEKLLKARMGSVALPADQVRSMHMAVFHGRFNFLEKCRNHAA